MMLVVSTDGSGPEQISGVSSAFSSGRSRRPPSRFTRSMRMYDPRKDPLT